jgi:hypothetical protein
MMVIQSENMNVAQYTLKQTERMAMALKHLYVCSPLNQIK